MEYWVLSPIFMVSYRIPLWSKYFSFRRLLGCSLMNNLPDWGVLRRVQNEILWILFSVGLEHFCVIANWMNYYLLSCVFSSEGQNKCDWLVWLYLYFIIDMIFPQLFYCPLKMTLCSSFQWITMWETMLFFPKQFSHLLSNCLLPDTFLWYN